MRRRAALLAALLLVACSRAEEPAPQPTAALPGAPPEGFSPNAQPELVALLREDRDRPRDPSDGGGRAWLAPGPGGAAPHARAGEPGRFEIVYEAGPLGVAVGGRVMLQAPPFWGWDPAQIRDRDGPGYTEATSEVPAVTLTPEILDEGLFGVTIGGRPLRAGERLHLVYGAGRAGARADRFAERESPFFVAVDGDGDGVRAWLPELPTVDVAAGPPARLVASLPGVVRPGEPAVLHLALLDAQGSAGVEAQGEIALELPAGLEGPGAVPIGAGGLAQVSLRAKRPGLFRVRATSSGGLEAESNPLLVARQAPRVLWADLHGHSHLSDGTGTPEDFYRYARDVAGLDAAVLTDHDHWGVPFLDQTPANWRRIQQAARDFEAPGRFVTLLGYEWTSWLQGHRHVLDFGDGDAPIVSSLDEATDTPAELWAALRGRPALTFAHHTAGEPIATNWAFAPDPELEPVVEVASVHGSSEAADAPTPVRGAIPGHFVRDALERGYRLGFVGSGDGHDGHPGLTRLASWSGGLAAVLSEDLTREGLLAALRARRCYATNGPRILLDVRLDGALQGSVVPARRGARIEVRVAGTAPLATVELIGGNRVLQRIDGGDELDFAADLDLSETKAGQYYYVRVVQRDDGAAWSSPFFIQ